MKKGRKEILESMLKFSNYYWYDSSEDSVSNQLINVEDYDPVVDIIFKANAYELEKIYGEIETSNERILDNLVNTLIPDHNLLPKPAFTVAKIQPKFSRLRITPEDVFKIEGKDDIGTDVEYYFTTIGNHEYPNSAIRYILTDSICLDYTEDEIKTLDNVLQANPYKRTKSMWLGIAIEDEIEDYDEISLFIGDKILDAFDFDTNTFSRAKWSVSGEQELQLKTEIGLKTFFKEDAKRNHEISKFIDRRKNLYEEEIIQYFNSSFVTLSGFPIQLSEIKTTKPHLTESINMDNWQNKEPLLWIKAEFETPIANQFIIDNPIHINALLLINRQLQKQQVVKNNFDRIVLPLPTQDYFLSIHSIWDEKSEGSNGQTNYYEEIDYINFDDKPGTYTIRAGNSIRRVNQQDISTKIMNLVDLIEEEYSSFKEGGVNRLKEDFDAIEKSVNRIRKQLPNIYENEEIQTSFYTLANFRKRASIISYNYWETQGDKVNNIALKTGLEISSESLTLDRSFTIIPIQKGRSTVNKIHYHNNLKKAILSRNSIVTMGDIKNYCLTTFKSIVQSVEVEKSIAPSDKETHKYENIILVKLKVDENEIKDLDKTFIKLQIQNALNSKSSFFTPIKVELERKVA